MQEIEMTDRRVLSVWWACTWRAGLGMILIGIGVHFVGRIFNGLLHAPAIIDIVVTIANVLLGSAWSVFAFGMAFKRTFAGFRVAFIADVPPSA